MREGEWKYGTHGPQTDVDLSTWNSDPDATQTKDSFFVRANTPPSSQHQASSTAETIGVTIPTIAEEDPNNLDYDAAFQR